MTWREKGDRIKYGRRLERYTVGQESEHRCVVRGNGEWGTGCSYQQVPDARKARDFQNTKKKMRLAEIPNKGEGEQVETISRG